MCFPLLFYIALTLFALLRPFLFPLSPSTLFLSPYFSLPPFLSLPHSLFFLVFLPFTNTLFLLPPSHLPLSSFLSLLCPSLSPPFSLFFPFLFFPSTLQSVSRRKQYVSILVYTHITHILLYNCKQRSGMSILDKLNHAFDKKRANYPVKRTRPVFVTEFHQLKKK